MGHGRSEIYLLIIFRLEMAYRDVFCYDSSTPTKQNGHKPVTFGRIALPHLLATAKLPRNHASSLVVDAYDISIMKTCTSPCTLVASTKLINIGPG